MIPLPYRFQPVKSPVSKLPFWTSEPETTRLKARAWPTPVVTFENQRLAVYAPAVRLLATELRLTVTLLLAPMASDPAVAETLSQAQVLTKDQFSGAPPALVR